MNKKVPPELRAIPIVQHIIIVIINGSISKKNQRPFEIDTKTSSVKKSIPTESKKSLSKTTLAAILLK